MKRIASVLMVMLALSVSGAYGQQAYRGPEPIPECTDRSLFRIILAQKERYLEELALSEAAERELSENIRRWKEKATTPEAPQAYGVYMQQFTDYCYGRKEYHDGVLDTLRAILRECYPSRSKLLEKLR